MPESTYHQIHFAWADPTLLGRVGPGPASSSLTEDERLTLRAWRNRLQPALTVDYRVCMPDPAEHPETLWVRAYEDGQAALVYRWPGDVESAHAWAIVGPTEGLTFPRVLSLHENPNTRPHRTRPPAPGWAAMPVLDAPEPWERSAAPGAVRARDRRAADLAAPGGEELLALGVAAALERPDLPVRVFLDPERADLWNAVQLRFLWGLHRSLYEVLSPRGTSPAPGWEWSLSTYDPVLEESRQHIVFGPPTGAAGPLLRMPGAGFRTVAERLVGVLREEGGNALAEHLAERGVPDAPTFGERRDLLADWLDPRPSAPRTGGGSGDGDDRPLAADAAEPGAEAAPDAPDHLPEPPVDTPVPEVPAAKAPAARPEGAARLRRFITEGAFGGEDTDAVATEHPGPIGAEAPTGPADASAASGDRNTGLPAGAEHTEGSVAPGGPARPTGSGEPADDPLEAEPLPREAAGPGDSAGPERATAGEDAGDEPPVAEPLPRVPADSAERDDDLPEAEPLPGVPADSGAAGSARLPGAGEAAEAVPADSPDVPKGPTNPTGRTDSGSALLTSADLDGPTDPMGRTDSGSALLPSADLDGPTDPVSRTDIGGAPLTPVDPAGPTDPTRITSTEGPTGTSRFADPTDTAATDDDLPEAESLPGDTGGGSAPLSSPFRKASPARDLPARAWASREAAAEAASALPEVEPPGTDETGPQAPPEPSVPSGRAAVEPPDSDPDPGPGEPLWPGLAPASSGGADPDEALWPSAPPTPGSGADDGAPGPHRPRIAPTHTETATGPGPEPSSPDDHRSGEGRPPRIFDAPEPRRPRIAPAVDPEPSRDSEPPRDPEPPASARRSPSPIRTGLFRKRTTRRDTPAGGTPRAAEPDTPRPDGRVRALAEGAFGGRPTRSTPQPPDPEEFPPAAERTPDEAPPLFPDASEPDAAAAPHPEPPGTPDYAAETAPEPSEHVAPEDNWPTQYVDLPLDRLERWLTKYGPEEARIDLVDARAAVRAERSELQRVRDERDHYHAELQDSRREVARLDRSWIDREDDDEPLATGSPQRRWPVRALVALLLFAFLVTGLEAGARFGVGALDLLGRLADAPWWPL